MRQCGIFGRATDKSRNGYGCANYGTGEKNHAARKHRLYQDLLAIRKAWRRATKLQRLWSLDLKLGHILQRTCENAAGRRKKLARAIPGYGQCEQRPRDL